MINSIIDMRKWTIKIIYEVWLESVLQARCYYSCEESRSRLVTEERSKCKQGRKSSYLAWWWIVSQTNVKSSLPLILTLLTMYTHIQAETTSGLSCLQHIHSCAAKQRRLEERCLKLLGSSKELGFLLTNQNQALMSQNDWKIHLSCQRIKIGLQGLTTNVNCY